MPEFLQVTLDKFTFQVAKDRLYSSDGIWVLPKQSEKPQRVQIGVTDYFQQHNGDVAFATLKPQGTPLQSGEELGELETMKVVVGLPSPLGGTIIEINKALVRTPELINQDPYDKGWLAEIEVKDWEGDCVKLLDPQAYLAVMQSQAEQELGS